MLWAYPNSLSGVCQSREPGRSCLVRLVGLTLVILVPYWEILMVTGLLREDAPLCRGTTLPFSSITHSSIKRFVSVKSSIFVLYCSFSHKSGRCFPLHVSIELALANEIALRELRQDSPLQSHPRPAGCRQLVDPLECQPPWTP